MGKERIKNPKHPTQKPISILKHIIKISTNANDIVLDPFMGSGSTGVASLQLKRKFIGIELNEDFYNISNERLKNTLPELEKINWDNL